jgi:hypothetical protein
MAELRQNQPLDGRVFGRPSPGRRLRDQFEMFYRHAVILGPVDEQ